MTSPSLFESHMPPPLAERLRPQSLGDVQGQDHLLGPKGTIAAHLKGGRVPSCVLWGPPGCGKTTIAQLMAREVNYEFVALSAIFSGVADLRKVFEEAERRKLHGVRTLLFVDEIHRFNKAQQDAFLPYVERGVVTLIGATTENPSFEMNGALLSRCQVFTLKRLSDGALNTLCDRGCDAVGVAPRMTPESTQLLVSLADGDGRYLLNMVESLSQAPGTSALTPEAVLEVVQRRAALYDKGGEGHYNLMSAFHKSLRGSDTDAALYWLARMLAGGEDPLYVARRMIRFASEDVGLADPQALVQALAARDAYHTLGSPEGELALVQCAIYLGTAPKSNAAYGAWKAVQRAAKDHGSHMPPKHILNAPTKFMKQEGYGAGYQYDHDAPQGFSGQNYFPETLERQTYYTPKPIGFEREICKRLDYWAGLRQTKD